MNRIKRAQKELESLKSDLGWGGLHTVSRTSTEALLVGLKWLELQLSIEGPINARSGSASDERSDDPDNLSDLHG